ncbi:MAG: hypothetical protein WB586_24820 [Chthoniobacterales bacterium]
MQEFAKEVRQQWQAEVPEDPAEWQGLVELRDLYLALETLGEKANLLSERMMFYSSIATLAFRK